MQPVKCPRCNSGDILYPYKAAAFHLCLKCKQMFTPLSEKEKDA